MTYFQTLPLLLLCLIVLSLHCSADDPLGSSCNDDCVLSPPTSYNLDCLLTDLVQKAEYSGYYSTSIGDGESQIYGLAQCRRDVSSDDCSKCLEEAAKQIRRACPIQAGAKIWYDVCFLRYSQDNFLGKVDTAGLVLYQDEGVVSEPDLFKKELGSIFHRISDKAAQPYSDGLGKDQQKVCTLETLYALVQCTEDLPPLYCAQCLAVGIQSFEGKCKYRKGCRVLFGSCYLRYELYPFFYPVDPKATPYSPLKATKSP